MGIVQDILFSFAPLLIFLVLMIIVYFRGSKINQKLTVELENEIYTSLKPHTKEIKKVKIRPDEYEYRCTANNRAIRILTVHLKMVSRSFIIQWFVNLLVKEKEKLFIGTKLVDKSGVDEDPAYKFEMVPYRKKMFIRQRFEKFVEMDDIPTTEKFVDSHFMIKSESQAYVTHLVDNPELMALAKKLEPNIEHISITRSKEDTDPHISCTFNFQGTDENRPVKDMMKFFFILAQSHIDNHSTVKKRIAKGSKGKSMTSRRGSAKRGASKGVTKKSKVSKKKRSRKRSNK